MPSEGQPISKSHYDYFLPHQHNHNTEVIMTLEEINKKINQCIMSKKMIHLQIFGAVRKKNTDRVENRARALIDTIDEINRLENLKSQL